MQADHSSGDLPAPLTAADILVALNAGQVDCKFQPIVRLHDGTPVGLESLARLHHPARGVLTPDWFMPQVETAGLSLQLTEAVVRAALGGIDRGFLERKSMFLTINLPLDVLLLPEAATLLETYRQEAGLDTRHILIELTESRPVFDLPLLAAALQRWRMLGYHLAIDDLGPDMINQTNLVALPFHMVKLDKGIVLRARDNALAQRYLQRTIANAQDHSLAIIAEGIEDGALWLQMGKMGAQYGQGFLIAHAMPAAALPAWWDNWDARLHRVRQTL